MLINVLKDRFLETAGSPQIDDYIIVYNVWYNLKNINIKSKIQYVERVAFSVILW